MTTIYTIGHSTRSLDDFVAILKSFEIEMVCDIRTIPKSRRNPQFAGDVLQQGLAEHGIEYVHLKGLGGLRHARKDSRNAGWRNDSFRGYADYMQTEEFTQAVEDLIHLAKEKRVAIMCAEAVPWRCHRSLVGDALLVRGVEVEDITSVTRAQPHKMTPFAKVNGVEITYPAEGVA
jgi:uncharacterized protein (DUF488 family)